MNKAHPEIVFWQIMPSHHQMGAIRHLAEIWGGEVHGIFDVKILEERKKLGWQMPNMGRMHVHFLEDQDTPDIFVADFVQSHSSAIHVLGGFRGTNSVSMAWKQLKKIPDAKLGCIAERPYFLSWRAVLKWFWYRRFFRKYGCRFRAVLAMGTLGIESFRSLGCPREILFPYLYQADLRTLPELFEVKEAPGEPVRFVYVGQFISRKGVDLLLDALSRLPSTGWELTWIGKDGELETAVKYSSKAKHIYFAGPCKSDQILSHLAKYDVCLIPSRHDGWGMVVNEALTAGLGALVSNQVGAKDLVEVSRAGMVVQANSASELAKAMQGVLEHPEIVSRWKKRTRVFSPSISPEKVGAYLYDVLRYAFLLENCGKRPLAPWLTVARED